MHICLASIDPMTGGGDVPTKSTPGTNSTGESNKHATHSGSRKQNDVKRNQPKCEGRISELKGMTYDIVGYKRQDDFDKTTKEVVGYLKRKDAKYAYDAAEYIRLMTSPDWADERPCKPKPKPSSFVGLMWYA